MYVMQNVINSVKRLTQNRKLNLLTFCQGNEKYISLLCQTGHNFYVWNEVGNSQWNDTIEKAPSNLTIVSPSSPIITSFDAIICHDRADQYDHTSKIAKRLCLPIIMVDQCSKKLLRPQNVLESPQTSHIERLLNRQANAVVASNDLCTDWGSSRGLSVSIPTSIDLNKFKKDEIRRSENTFFESSLTPTRITFDNNIPRQVGEALLQPVSPSYSVLPTDCEIEDKEIIYQTSNYFVHPHRHITVKALEAMASENVVICVQSPEIQEFFNDGVDAVIVKSPLDLVTRLAELDNDEPMREKIGEAARKRVQSMCNGNNFVEKWNFVFDFIRSSFYQPL